MNRQTNIYPSSIEGELKRQQSMIDSSYSQLQCQPGLRVDESLMPQLKYGLGFSHQDVNEKIRKVSGNKEDTGTEPVIIVTRDEEGVGSQDQATSASDATTQKLRKWGRSLIKRSNAAQPSPDASSSDQSSSGCGNERPKVKFLSPEPTSKRKHSSSSCGKGKGFWVKYKISSN